MTELSDVISALETFLSSDTDTRSLVDMVTTDTRYDKVPRGMRVHVRPVNPNTNEQAHIGARKRDVHVGLVLVGNHSREDESDDAFALTLEALDRATRMFASQSELVNRRTMFDSPRELADEYTKFRIEYAIVGFSLVEVFAH